MSKSVKERTSEATTGRRKKTPIRPSAGATNQRAGAIRRRRVTAPPRRRGASGASRAARPRSRRARRAPRPPSWSRAPPPGVPGDLGRDPLPLGDLRGRAHGLELRPERTRLRVTLERRLRPRLPARGKVAGQPVEADLLGRLREGFDQLPGGVLARRTPEHGDARAARGRDPP